MKSKAFIFFLLIITLKIWAINPTDHTVSTVNSFDIQTYEPLKKFEDAVFLPEGFLKKFNPASVSVTKKVINGNEFEYVVVKNILGFKKTFHLLGSINFERKNHNCKPNEISYVSHVDFTRSGPEITDTISDFYLAICTVENSANLLKVTSLNTLYYKGNKFNAIYEAIAKSLINDQVNAIFTTIKNEVLTK